MSLKNFTRTSEEVFVSSLSITCITRTEIEELKDVATTNPRSRVRVNAHKNIDDPLHEMLIIHKKGMYCQPHKHLNKSESFHMIEGRIKVVLFDNDGVILQAITMGISEPDETLFYRISEPIYHMVILESDFAVYHEVTNGPFQKEDSLFAPWAPADNQDKVAQQEFMSTVLTNKQIAV